jgi:hypothetical protein
MAGTDSVNNQSNVSGAGACDNEQLVPAALEPYVTADDIAVFINEPRRNVLRMAREGKLTCYLMSGSQRHTYKFKISEVSRDMEKLRRPCGTASEGRSNTRPHNR